MIQRIFERPSGWLRRFIVLVIISIELFVPIIVPKPTSAQEPPPIEQLAIRLHEGGISLYNVDRLGQFHFITTLTGFNLSRLSYSVGAEWEIVSPSDIVASPDGRRIAFTSMRSTGETALFVYTLGQTELHQVAAPGIGILKWSPQNDAILLAPAEVLTSSSVPYVQDVYLYALVSDSFVNLTNTPQDVEQAVQWLPDGNHILYDGALISCTAPCMRYRNLNVFDRSTQNQSELVDLGTQLPTNITLPSSDVTCFPHNMVWSTANQRVYYAVSCVDMADQPHSALFSVDLQGDNRVEIDLTALYPDEEFTAITDLSGHPKSSNLYLLVKARFLEGVNNPQQVGRWRIFTESDRTLGTGC